MEPRILTLEEIGQASDIARGVFDYCLRRSITQPELISSFEEYAQPERLQQMAEEGSLVVWGIFMDGQMCAMSAMQSEGHITMLYVLPVYQRKGLGKQLLRTMRKYAGDEFRLERVTLNAMPVWTTTYFEKMGFQRMGTPQYGYIPFLSLQAKAIADIRYPVKPIPEKIFIGIVGGFLAVIFLVAILFMLL